MYGVFISAALDNAPNWIIIRMGNAIFLTMNRVHGTVTCHSESMVSGTPSVLAAAFHLLHDCRMCIACIQTDCLLYINILHPFSFLLRK
jgi:hypothetical protein